MFLEPVYLNESMLMNCASYFFGGIGLEAETKTKSENQKNIQGQGKGGAGFDILGNIAKATGELSLQGEKKDLYNFEITMVRRYTLGAIHMNVIQELEKNNLAEISSKSLKQGKPNENYSRIKSLLKPVDFYSIIQILKLSLPQFEKFFTLMGEKLFQQDNQKHKSKLPVVKKHQDAIKLVQILNELIIEIEKNYLESNQLEMVMYDESGKILGIVDIDVKDKNPNEIKAQLTDGEFYIFGKVVRYFKKDEQISLVQRSVLSILIEKLNAIIVIMGYFNQNSDKEGQAFINNWVNLTNQIESILNMLLVLKVEGPVVRIKAMSICM